jgi:peptidase E
MFNSLLVRNNFKNAYNRGPVMAKLYFLGGENVVKRDAKEINQLAFEDAGDAPRVLVFTWARPSFDARFVRKRRLTGYLRSLGAGSVEYAEFSNLISEITVKVADADLIYITGGQVSTLLSRLQCSGADALVRSFGGVIVGRSAGAMALGKWCLVTNRYSKRPRSVEGLGLVDFSVKAHYEPAKERLLAEASKEGKIYAISQRAAVISRDGALSFVGEVFLFENGEKTRAQSVSVR